MANDNINLDNNSFTIYYQNICGLKGKIDELISSMSPNFPHILCLSEHHLKHTELDQINIEGFISAPHIADKLGRGEGSTYLLKKVLSAPRLMLTDTVKIKISKFVC